MRMRHAGALLLVLLACWPAAAGAQRAAARRPAQPAAKTEPAVFDCLSLLGQGVTSGRSFCDVLTGRDPAAGIIIPLPPHTGTVTLTFDLHNRHTYSEELIKANRAYRHYTATIGVLTADNTLLARAVVQNEFRTAADLLDRVGGGAGPGGVKAVAPTGTEPISIVIPAAEQSVSILGEKLAVVRPDGVDNFSAPGRPVAVISNVMLTYRPGPVRRPATRR
ncbi:MAG: hypothetical protein A3F70_09615 [Acidobacteria bacterium RIFCSPLOWO2_12_FULL_67_14]|nr:MAG: hypothetical protein A3H29_09860 [Acidobacteria bacterium RIFCSPLOWO2_02_FULL_67_21]OFW38285.1 MAG: hypothetical protein A3F70_09615 [Acidobacteria bacterium RIFCSPLOWO2_12_FULL_67_14]